MSSLQITILSPEEQRYPPFLTVKSLPFTMCTVEVYGDWYSDCKHFVEQYTGNSYDCMNKNCGLSKEHAHTARICPCPKTIYEDRKIRNTFRTSKYCPTCNTRRDEDFERRVGRRTNNEAQD